MTGASDENRTIAKAAASAFGGRPKVVRHWDEHEKSSVDILICADRPQKGVTAYSTIGLSESPLLKEGEDIGVRVELVGACASSCGEFANILSTAAFCIVNSGWFCSPGTIFPDVVGMYECSSTMRHLLFVPPFLWEGELETLHLEARTVAWLLAVPISEAEYRFAEAEGADELERAFERAQIDIFNINRPSVL